MDKLEKGKKILTFDLDHLAATESSQGFAASGHNESLMQKSKNRSEFTDNQKAIVKAIELDLGHSLLGEESDLGLTKSTDKVSSDPSSQEDAGEELEKTKTTENQSEMSETVSKEEFKALTVKLAKSELTIALAGIDLTENKEALIKELAEMGDETRDVVVKSLVELSANATAAKEAAVSEAEEIAKAASTSNVLDGEQGQGGDPEDKNEEMTHCQKAMKHTENGV